MAQTCLHCLKRLPGNDVLEAFPFGKQVAYDPARQRFWVVCGRCRRWAIAPRSEGDRGSAIDYFERWWRSTSAHYSTGGVGLGQFNERFSVVRVGDASFNEFASWRHATTLRRRNVRYWAGSVVSASAIGLGMGLVGSAALGTAVAVFGAWWAMDQYRWWNRVSKTAMCRVPAAGARATVREKHIATMELVRRQDGWALNTKHDGGVTTLEGNEAVRALSYAVPRLNHAGARQRSIEVALAMIEEAGGPEGLTQRVAERITRGTRGYNDTGLLLKQHGLSLIALEIATQEQNERRLMENELALLHGEWREAEEIATTVDRLELPGGRA